MYRRIKKSTAVLLLFLMIFSLFNCGISLAETATANYDENSFREVFKDAQFANVLLNEMGQNPNNVDWTKVNDESLSKIAYLNLYGNIQSLDGLEKLTGLMYLVVAGTKIQGFPAGIENNLKNLSRLSLDRNQNPLFIPRFTTLTSLSFIEDQANISGQAGQPLDIKSKDSIQAMVNLQNLEINGQASLAGLLDYSKFTALQTLNISNCNLYTIPESILSLPNLANINMNYNNLPFIPDSAIEYVKNHDIKINLSNNFIDSVDSSVSNKIVISSAKGLEIVWLPNIISTADKVNLISCLNYKFAPDKYEFNVNSVSQPESNDASISSDGILSVNYPGTYNITVRLKGASVDNINAVVKGNIVVLDPSDPYFYNQERMEKEFPDPVFRNAVLSTLGQSPGNVNWANVNQKTIENLSYLYLYGNIEKLDGLEKLTGLNRLDVIGTNIQGFPNGVENNLKNLKYLSLSSNQNSLYIPKFTGLTYLSCRTSYNSASEQAISISGPALDLRSKDSIQAMENLQYLDLSTQNQIAGNLDYSVFKSLQTLDISSCNLDSVPGEIVSLPNLRNLNMSGNNLTFVPKELIEYAKNHDIGINLRENFISTVDRSVADKISVTDAKRLKFQDLPGRIPLTDKTNLINYLNYKFSPDKYEFSVFYSISQPESNYASVSSDGILSVNTPGTYYIQAKLKGDYIYNESALATANILVYKTGGPKIYDLDSDGFINMSDIMMIASSFNSDKTSARYNEKYDFNLDRAINMADIMMLASCFNMQAN